MSELFIRILNMGVTASWLILAVIAARLLLKKAPKWISCLLWALVAVRLVCPVTLKSALSLVPSAEPISPAIAQTQEFRLISGDAPAPSAVESLPSQPQSGANGTSALFTVLAVVWLAGVAAMLVYALVSYLKLKKSVSHGVRSENGTLVCEGLRTPFILGVFRPVICLPADMAEDTRMQVLRHERAHLKRLDHLFKPLGFLLLSVYWFHPLCWAAYILLCRDIESACDEKVLREIGEDRSGVAAYSQALLDCSFQRKKISACPLAFGEVGVKQRIRGILNYKKPAFWVIVAALVGCAAIAVCLMTDPFSEKELTGKLAVSMDAAVSEHCRPDCGEGLFYAQDINVLKVKRSGGAATVYAMVMWGGYSYNGAAVAEECGAYVPTAVTFDTSVSDDAAVYPVIEYWEPRDGGYYADDIRAKFPLSVRKKVFDRDGAEGQIANCEKAALEYYGAAAPATAPDGTEEGERRVTLIAQVAQMNGSTMLVRPTQGSAELASADLISIPTSYLPSSVMPKAGDLVQIEYDGSILESYPAQLNKIYSAVVFMQGAQASFTAVTRIASTSWSENEKITGEALNANAFPAGAGERLPVYKFDTKEELDRFKKEFGEILDLGHEYDGPPSFNAVTRYDDAFFADHTVILAYMRAGSGSFRYAVRRVFISGRTLCMEIDQKLDPAVPYTEDMAGWFALAEVKDEDIKDCTAFDAWLINNGGFVAGGVSFPIPEGFVSASRAELRRFLGEDSNNFNGFRNQDDTGHTVSSVLIGVYVEDAADRFAAFTAENLREQYASYYRDPSVTVNFFEEKTIRGLTAKVASVSLRESTAMVFCFMNNGQCAIAEYNVNKNASENDVIALQDSWLGIAPA